MVSSTTQHPTEAIRTVEVGRVCVWTADLTSLHAYHDVFASDIDELLEQGNRNLAAYGEQTTTSLHKLTTPHWKLFFSEIQRIFLRVVETSVGSVDEGLIYFRAWASRLGGGGNYEERDLYLRALHNHSPAFLSAVYYLRLTEGTEEEKGGTFFVNPFPQSITSPHPGILISPAVGRVVIFPSWLTHGPQLLDYMNMISPRLIIAIDAHYVPK